MQENYNENQNLIREHDFFTFLINTNLCRGVYAQGQMSQARKTRINYGTKLTLIFK